MRNSIFVLCIRVLDYVIEVIPLPFIIHKCQVCYNLSNRYKFPKHQADFSPRFPLERIDPGMPESRKIYYPLWVAPKRLSNAFYPIKKGGKGEGMGRCGVRQRERMCPKTAVNRRMWSLLEFRRWISWLALGQRWGKEKDSFNISGIPTLKLLSDAWNAEREE